MLKYFRKVTLLASVSLKSTGTQLIRTEAVFSLMTFSDLSALSAKFQLTDKLQLATYHSHPSIQIVRLYELCVSVCVYIVNIPSSKYYRYGTTHIAYGIQSRRSRRVRCSIKLSRCIKQRNEALQSSGHTHTRTHTAECN